MNNSPYHFEQRIAAVHGAMTAVRHTHTHTRARAQAHTHTHTRASTHTHTHTKASTIWRVVASDHELHLRRTVTAVPLCAVLPKRLRTDSNRSLFHSCIQQASVVSNRAFAIERACVERARYGRRCVSVARKTMCAQQPTMSDTRHAAYLLACLPTRARASKQPTEQH